MKLRIAICQFPVSCDIAGNAKLIRRFMKQAAKNAGQVIHFPETALSGYGRSDFTPSSTDNWQKLEEHTREIVGLANLVCGLSWVRAEKLRTGKNPRTVFTLFPTKGKSSAHTTSNSLRPVNLIGMNPETAF